MGLIKNFSSLATSEQRKLVLNVIEAGLVSIQPSHVMQNHFFKKDNFLHIKEDQIDLSLYKRVFVIGFGKGSAGIAKIIETTLGGVLTDGFVIDTVEEKFEKIHFTLGTHPLPSQQNIDFTKNVLEKIHDLTEEDLVMVVICGGGSAMFELPVSLTVEKLISVFKDLLKSGANISEMNAVRKHLSKVKGGGLAYHLFPARVVSLIFSDVPGNDLSVIASGPTVKDNHTLSDTKNILRKYQLSQDLTDADFEPTPTDDKYFKNVSNIIMVSNVTALNAMKSYAQVQGCNARIYSDRFQGDAKIVGKELIAQAKSGEMLLVGGETTVHVKGRGIGGRNQTLVLSSLSYLDDKTIIACFDSDGWDFTTFAGAIGDLHTKEKAQEMRLDLQSFLDNDDSTTFFKNIGDGIDTGRLESNVSDLMIVYKL